jgi:pimeloyl-ACP methyl ester carboxylesterase
VTGHPQAHLGNSAAGGGSWTGDGALKPSPPRRGDIIASRLAAPTTNNLAHHRTGAGESLVLLHGVGESAVGWRPVHQALSDDYDVIAFDLPGFGRSPALPQGVTPTAAALADAVEQELDRLGVARFHVAGYSLGARVALELATRGRTLSVIAIAPDGLGTPLERLHQAAALLSGRTLAMLLAPIATPLAATGAGRSLFFAMERSRPWQLPADDARQLLLDFAQAPGYLDTVQAAMVDVPGRLDRIACPVLLLQGTADPLVSMQSPRFLAFVRHAQLQWLPGLSHVPISDDPQLVATIMLRFLKTATEQREHGRRLPAQRRSRVSSPITMLARASPDTPR